MEMTAIAQALTLTYSPHPLLPVDRVVMPAQWQAGRTVREYLVASGIDAHREIVIRNNNTLLTVAEWDIICPVPGDIVNVEGVVSGGGGKGGSNPIAMVLSIAVMVMAPQLAAMMYTSMGGTIAAGAAGMAAFTGSMTGMAMVAGISIAGNLVISALFRPSQASTNAAVTGQGAAESPTYSLSGGSNRMRPYEPLAVVMGNHRIFPDYAAKPYTEYEGEDQYLYQAFNFGIGDLELSDLRIGETLLSSYADVTITRAVNGVLPGFFGNVDTTEGAELTAATGWVVRTSGTDTTKLAVDIGVSLFYANDSGGIDGRTVNLAIEYAVAGSGVWKTFFPTLGESTFYHPATHEFTLWNAKTKPMRVTYALDVPIGQYDVRVKRASPDETDIKATSTAAWAVLRSYQDGIADYSNQTVIGIKIKASGQLNGALQQLSAIADNKARVWTGSAWAMQATTNPAWWYLDFIRGRKDDEGHLLYGCGLSDEKIDIEAIKAFAVFCDANGLTFSVVLDRQQNAADVMNMICRCGFGSPSRASGKLGAVWDAVNQSPVMAFGMSNICKGSFEVAYVTENLTDEIVINYTNRDTWETDQVRVTVPGTIGTPLRPSTIELMGCTVDAMAAKFAHYIAGQQLYRRRMITWETDFEGFVCQRGDVVLLAHDLTQWGYSGRIVSVDGLTITLDRTVPRSGAAEYLMMQSPDGDTQVFTIAAGAEDSDTITLPSAFALQDGYPAVDHKWYFSPMATPGKKVKIVSVQPLSESRVRLIATDEDPAYYASWDGEFTAPAVQTLLTNVASVTRLSLKLHQVVIDNFQVNRVTASWRQTGGTQYCTVRAWLDGVAIGTWTRVTDAAIEIDLSASVGTVSVEVTPFGAQGSGVSVSSSLSLSMLPAPAAPVVVATPALFAIDVKWLFGDARQDVRYTELWFSQTNSRAAASRVTSEPYPGARYLHIGIEPGEGGYYWARVIDTRGNPSEWSSASNAGVYATVSTDPADLLTQLQSALGMPQLAAELAAPISQISGMATDILQRAIDIDGLSERVLFERAVTDATIAIDPTTGKIKLLATAVTTTDVEARLTQAEVDINAAEGTLTSTVATLSSVSGELSSAQSQIAQLANSVALGVSDVKISEIAGQVAGSITVESAAAAQALAETALRQALGLDSATDADLLSRSNVALAQFDIKANSDAVSAEATARLVLAAAVASNLAILTIEQTARATADSAEASARETLAATVGQNTAAIQTEQTARATTDGALASQISTVQASLNGSIASVQETASAAASAVGGVEAKWGVKVQAMADGRRAMAGVELLAGTDGESVFAILADRLLIYKPDGSGAPRQIVTLGTVNGVTALGLDGSLIVDGSIVARCLAVKTITAESGVIGDLAVGTLQLAGHAVTVPFVTSAVTGVAGAGIGTKHPIVSGTIAMAQPGVLYASFMAPQGYSSGIRESYTTLSIDGLPPVVVGGAMAYQTNVAVSTGAYVSAGNHTVSIVWEGQDGTVSLSPGTLFIQGAMK